MSKVVGNVLKQMILVAGTALLAVQCHATDIGYSGVFQGTEGSAKATGQTVAATYTRDMNTTGDRVSMQIVSSTYTLAASVTFSSANYIINTPTITVTNNFTMGFQVLFSSGALAPITGLTLGTTYYVSPITSKSFKLALTSTGAVAGVGIVLASTNSVTNVYTLAPLAFTNTGGGIQLQWSDDKVTFFNATTGNYGATISSVTFASAGATALWDLGPVQHRYLRLNETPSTTGAVNYTATDNERYSFKH